MHLIVVLAVFAALGAAEAVRQPGGALWGESLRPSTALAMVAGTMMLIWTLLRWRSRHVLARLERQDETSLRRGLRLAARSEILGRWLITAAYVGQLTIGGWARLVEVQWQMWRWWLADEAVLLVPFVLMLLAHWNCHYPVNRRVREWIMMGQLAEGLAARPVWSRRQYLSFQVRSGLGIVLVPLSVIVGIRDLSEWLARTWLPHTGPWVAELATVAGAGLVFLFGPLLLRRVWVTTPLPTGPLREKLETFCRRIKLGYREILLWRTHSAVANAAVMGLLPQVRFVLLSDAVIEQVGDEQIEAIFGHEAGHVKHHHLLYLGMLILGGGSFAVLLGKGVCQLLVWAVYRTVGDPDQAQALLGTWDDLIMCGGLAFTMVAAVLVFGWISRRLEHQADIYAARAVAGQLHPPGRDEQLDPHGAWAMGTALVRLALLNGMPIESRSWRHPSIASRASFLRDLSDTPGGLWRYHRRLWWMKLAIFVMLVLGTAGSAVLYWLSLRAQAGA